LIEAFNGLGPDAELQVWGSSGQREYLEQVKAQAAHPGIQFCGRYSNDALPQILSAVDVVVTPSVWHETFSLTVREAFMAHLPVIASNMGGYPEAVQDGVNGFLFPAGNAAALRERMQAFLDDPELVNRLRANIGPVKDIREYAEEMEQLYDSLLRQRPAGR
jgi:glycosyltransferase involved in cell wall biosynthesis